MNLEYSNKYSKLASVMVDAVEQASKGKGKERHADDEAFEQQKICVINRWIKDSPVAGALFQAVKKTVESSRLPSERAITELLGAMNYLAAAVILLKEYMNEPNVKEKGENIGCVSPGTIVEVDHHPLVNHIPVTFCGEEDFPKLCADCAFFLVDGRDYPCKKCIDKPFKPHHTPC